jgi:hypothetical protein
MGVSACVLLTAGAATAQDDSATFIFGEYYGCDQNREGFSDYLTEQVFGPMYDKRVKAGDLTGWGWLSHNAGGSWRRVMFYAANDLNKLLETRDSMIEEMQTPEIADANREFTSICPDHDDLIWRSVVGSSVEQTLGTRSAASYSTYYVCDVTKQERADEIVKELYAPELDALVKAGELDSWGWYAHVIGNQYRRMWTHRAKSHGALVEAVQKYNDAAEEKNEAMADELGQICNSHVDYLWDVKLPKPDAEAAQ